MRDDWYYYYYLYSGKTGRGMSSEQSSLGHLTVQDLHLHMPWSSTSMLLNRSGVIVVHYGLESEGNCAEIETAQENLASFGRIWPSTNSRDPQVWNRARASAATVLLSRPFWHMYSRLILTLGEQPAW